MITLLIKCLSAKRRPARGTIGPQGRRTAAAAIGATLGVLVGLSANALPSPAHEDSLPSAGCGQPSPHAGMVNLKSSDGEKRERTYSLQAPASYAPTHPYSLVFVFHGAAGSSRTSYGAGFQDVAGASDDGIFVFPDGIKYKNTVVAWDDAGNGYDVPFFDHMLGDIESAYCIDTTRVFAAGGSWGGDFVIALACHRGEKLRAVEVNSSGDEYADTASFLTYQGIPCPSKKHPAVLFEHAVGGDGAYPAPDFATTSRLFKYLNSCGAGGQIVPPHTKVMACVAYRSCAAAYTECFFDSSIGHAQPPNLTQDTWNFFSRF